MQTVIEARREWRRTDQNQTRRRGKIFGMTEELPTAVLLATLEKAHRQAVEEVMQSEMSDVARISLILAMEAEHLGRMESLRVAWHRVPTPQRGGRHR